MKRFAKLALLAILVLGLAGIAQAAAAQTVDKATALGQHGDGDDSKTPSGIMVNACKPREFSS